MCKQGVRPLESWQVRGYWPFNPRTSKGCDFRWMYVSSELTEFQSTHPQGVRRDTIDWGEQSFNISIHARARGATNRRTRIRRSAIPISIHAPARGATYIRHYLSYKHYFQSTHPQGVRLGDKCGIPKTRCFQSTHPQGGATASYIHG